jgi:hypothetical protein
MSVRDQDLWKPGPAVARAIAKGELVYALATQHSPERMHQRPMSHNMLEQLTDELAGIRQELAEYNRRHRRADPAEFDAIAVGSKP